MKITLTPGDGTRTQTRRGWRALPAGVLVEDDGGRWRGRAARSGAPSCRSRRAWTRWARREGLRPPIGLAWRDAWFEAIDGRAVFTW